MIYLASPYTHPDECVEGCRFEAVCVAAAALMRRGHHIFSPIAHTHPIKEAGGLPQTWAYWHLYDRWYLDRVDEVWVLTLEGWADSTGVCAERDIALARGIPVRYVDPVTYGITPYPAEEP